MKLLVVVLCLLSERYLMHSLSSQRFVWFGHYCQQIQQVLGKITSDKGLLANPWVALSAFTLPLIALCALLYGLLHGLLFGLVGFLLNIAFFFYCLGPDNPFYPVLAEDGKATSEVVGSYFVAVMRQLFALLFWYMILGPIAALTYRLVTLCQQQESSASAARQVTMILEWLPVRLTALLFLLVGNFQAGYKSLMGYLLAKPALNEEMLRHCGLEALRSQDSDTVSMVAAERLVEQATLVFLFGIALITLGAFV